MSDVGSETREVGIESSDLASLEAIEAPRTKGELLRRIALARPALEATVEVLSSDEMICADANGWSPKDHLAHIAAWERMIVAHVRDGTDAAVAGMTPDAYAAATLDGLNARLYELHRHLPAGDVLALFRDAHRDMLLLLDSLSDADLAEPYWPGDTRPVIDKITGDTYRHYLEHRRWILGEGSER